MKEVAIVDPAWDAGTIIDLAEQRGLRLIAILLTHGHFDHIYAVNDVVGDFDCPIYVHEKERDFLFDPNLNLSGTTYQRFVVTHKHKVEVLQEGDILTLGSDKIEVLHTPGHTRGSVSFIYKRFLFSGDTLFKGTIGRTDLPTSNKVDMERSLDKILKKCKDNTIVYPGHGHFTTILSEKYENPFIKQPR